MYMTVNVFLDDYRHCPQGYILAKDIDECLQLMYDHSIGHLSLDHDLESKTRNGLMLVHAMVEHQLFAERITIHSANSVGGKNMFRYLKAAQENDQMPHSIKIVLRPLPLR
ncbi:cyclic-phosphate processing receiver domain-containing protein [Rossellomorea marisflavi]|nr:cyclic-phosphate processing receiver domain-containing protein [Rossellomorea marisflavi]MDW4525016.1 cyclic-phosphate processing receiver domain-containing protein [Rossellomorea marisflavi]UTE72552.1 hypothetical protein M1I95_20195 [Rossellomorea marisflavi]VXC55765.1 conserved hypothetical protein [Bacillus sp. 349Y]